MRMIFDVKQQLYVSPKHSLYSGYSCARHWKLREDRRLGISSDGHGVGYKISLYPPSARDISEFHLVGGFNPSEKY